MQKCSADVSPPGPSSSRYSLYLLYMYKSTNTYTCAAPRGRPYPNGGLGDTQFACFTSAKVQILTQKALQDDLIRMEAADISDTHRPASSSKSKTHTKPPPSPAVHTPPPQTQPPRQSVTPPPQPPPPSPPRRGKIPTFGTASGNGAVGGGAREMLLWGGGARE